MTNEEKQLLLIDLCARLPYGVKVVFLATTYNVQFVEVKFDEVKLEGISHTIGIGYIKPYLRPMSSMTKEERKEYNDIVKNTIDFYGCPKSEDVCFFIIPIDWLNTHHFDYRGLIEKGLALEAPEGMYKTK